MISLETGPYAAGGDMDDRVLRQSRSNISVRVDFTLEIRDFADKIDRNVMCETLKALVSCNGPANEFESSYVVSCGDPERHDRPARHLVGRCFDA